MKIFLRFLAVLVLFTLLVTPIFASNVTNARYLTKILVTNTSTAASNIIGIFTINTAEMISGGMLSANASDTALRTSSGIDIRFMPGLSGNPWVFYLSSIEAYSQLNEYLYTKDVTGGTIRYFPGATGMTVTNNTSLNIVNSGNFTWSGYFNPTSTGYLLNKPNTITVQGNGSGNVTVGVVTGISGYSNNYTFKPNANGIVELTPSAGTNWQCVSDNNSGTHVKTLSATYLSDFYDTANHTTESAAISSVVVWMRLQGTAGSKATPQWKMGAISYNGTEISCGAVANYSQAYATSPATGLAWTWAEIDASQIGIKIKGGGGNWIYCQEISFIVRCNPIYITTSVSSPVISAGEHTIMAYLNGGFLGIKIDSSANNSVAFAGDVTINASPLVFVSGDITPYVNYIEVWKSGARTGYWYWEYGATFRDQSLNGNTGTPSFRTTSSDSDVTAAISSQESLITSKPPAVAESEAWSMLTDAEKALLTVTPSGLYSEGGILFPGGQVIKDFADDTRYPVYFYLYPLAIGSSILLGLLVMAKTYNPSRGIRGSLMLQAGTSLVCMVLWVFGGGGVIAGWILIPFGLWCAVLLLWRTPYSPIS